MQALLGMARKVWTHPSNEGSRSRALARGLYHFTATRVLRRTTTTALGDHSRIYVNPARNASSRAVIGNPPDPGPMRLVERVLRHGDLVIDVGANIGLYTIFAAEKGAEVIALEPGDTSELVRNLRLNRLEAEVIQVAVSREDGVGLFTVGRDQEDRVIVDSAATEPGTTKEVRLVALDSVLDGRTARLVKIDVEGNERLVVEGMVRTLADKRAEVLLLEWNDSSLAALGENREPVASLLLAAGYSLFRPDNQGRLVPENSPAPSDVDVVALSPSALLEFEALIVGTR